MDLFRLQFPFTHQQAHWYDLLLGCQSGAVVRSMFETSALVTSEGVGSIPSQTHSSCDRVGDSI
jgi:hypothetical protein